MTIKEVNEDQFIEKTEEMSKSKMEDFSSKTLNFRRAKKSLQPITPAEELMRFSEIMMQIINKK